MSPYTHPLPAHYAAVFNAFKARYLKAVIHTSDDLSRVKAHLASLLEHVTCQAKSPYTFAPLHHAIRAPFDYYAFGLDFMRPLIDLPRSYVLGAQWLDASEKARCQGANVIFFANHQIEADPQVLSILLESRFPRLAEELICVAGARVTSDPMAVPFTLGRNILSVHSKNHMDSDPHKRAAQQAHNLRALNVLSDLLNQGGHAIYVAPSGGRDRPNPEAQVLPAPFDPQSIQLFTLLSSKACKPVHFYPLALSSYAILPPPNTRQTELGEERYVAKSNVGIACGARLEFPPLPEMDRKERQQAYAHQAWQAVMTLYEALQRHLALASKELKTVKTLINAPLFVDL